MPTVTDKMELLEDSVPVETKIMTSFFKRNRKQIGNGKAIICFYFHSATFSLMFE